jgi:hypothetical protein
VIERLGGQLAGLAGVLNGGRPLGQRAHRRELIGQLVQVAEAAADERRLDLPVMETTGALAP